MQQKTDLPKTDKQFKSVLIVQTAFLGDVLLSVPLLKKIREQHPSVQISYICRKGLGAFLKSIGLVDEYFEIHKGERNSYQKVIEKLNSKVFDRIYCPHESLRSAFLVRKLHADKKMTFAKWWSSLFFDSAIEKKSQLPEALRQLQMLELDSDDIQKKLQNYSEKYKPEALNEVPEWANMSIVDQEQERSLICIFPGSVWPTKQWTKQGYIDVIKKLSANHQVVLMGGQEELHLANEILHDIPNVQNDVGKTSLQETLQILKKAKIVISNDSGGQHLAALANAPTVSIFGPTVVQFGYRPWNEKIIVVQNNSIKCRPCGKHGHQICPIRTHECMTSITAKQVLDAVDQLLGVS